MAQSSQVSRLGELLARKGLRLTDQRRVIVELFFEGDKHLSLNEILELARARKHGIGYATVYRTMRLLTEVGLAVEHRFGENQTRYEPKIEGEHHDHLICVDCGAILEFEDDEIEALQASIAGARGFDVVSHRHEVYVRCRSGYCLKDSAPGGRVGGS